MMTSDNSALPGLEMTTEITYQQYYGWHLVSTMSNTHWSGCLVCFKFPSEAEELMPHTSRVMELNTIKAKIMITTPKPTWTYCLQSKQ